MIADAWREWTSGDDDSGPGFHLGRNLVIIGEHRALYDRSRDSKAQGDSRLLKRAGKICAQLLDTPATTRLYPKPYNK
jgi:hypothetical protein